jgi:predicted acylesterase/phospholipase RssA
MAKLGAIPDELGHDMAKLFQPSSRTATAFDALMAWIRPGATKLGKLSSIAGIVSRSAFGWFVAAVIVAMIPAVVFDLALLGVPATAGDWFALACALIVWLPMAIVVGLAVAAIVVARKSVEAIAANGFGICDGHSTRAGTDFPPLTDWMDNKLRDLAGIDDRPVCFGDLWGPEAVARYRASLAGVRVGEAAALSPFERRELRCLRLTDCLVMTTDLSHRRPYRFPFDTQVFYWCGTCLGQYFPEAVVEHMARATEAVGPIQVGTTEEPREIRAECPRHAGEPLYYMPLAPDVPLVLAARISLSFPGLISAIPFHAVDWTRAAPSRDIVTVWFSDGGISSNFPMRFFDAAWPTRPTFGINLAPPHLDDPAMVWRPPPGRGGVLPRYIAMSSLGQFASAILDTMQNWADSVQITMPGFRDRVVEVRHYDDEGGMNLQMPPEKIALLAERGNEAGRNIVDGDAETKPFDFTQHRWMRYRNAMASMDDLLSGMHSVWPAERAFLDSIPRDHNSFAPASRARDRQATEKVMRLADDLAALGHPATTGRVPKPQPDLRLTPPL